MAVLPPTPSFAIPSSASFSTGKSPKKKRKEVSKAPQWVPDSKTKVCMICSKDFHVRRRKHHCRSCGIIVCASCSQHTMVLKYSNSLTPLRVCDKCYPKLKDEALEEVYNLGITVNEEDIFVDPRLKEHQIPAWTHALRPFSQHGNLVGVGRLYVKILTAENLPSMSASGTCDSYCTLIVGDEKQTTKVSKQSLSPAWNEEFVLTTVNSELHVHIDVFHQDSHFNDTPIGKVTIPLSELTHQKRFSSWRPLQLAPEAERKKKLADAKTSKTETRLRVEIQYTSSKIGEFLSMFSPQPEAKEEFNVDTLYYHSRRIYNTFEPLLAALLATIGLLRSPGISKQKFIARVALLALAFYPWTFTILVQLFLLRYIVWQFVYRAWAKKRLHTDAMISGGAVNPQTEDDHLSEQVHVLALNALTLSGSTDQLPKSQKAIRHVADTLDHLRGWFEWRHSRSTFRVFVLLLLSLIYSFVGCQANVWVAALVGVLCWNTATIQGVLWIYHGFGRYAQKMKRRTTQIGGVAAE